MTLPAVHRRAFLKVASVAAVGVAFGERKLFAAASSGIVPLLGVGYATALPENGFTTPMTDASSILSPDPSFINKAARIRVVGSARARQYATAAGGIGVDAYFPINGRENGKLPRFSFWSAAGDTPTGSVSFRMPALATTGLSFVVRRVRPIAETNELNTVPTLEPETSPLTLSLGNAEGPKLTRGVYAFAFREENGDSAPNWNRTSLINQNGKYSLSGMNVTYLLIEVDYDDEKIVPPAAPSGRNRAAKH